MNPSSNRAALVLGVPIDDLTLESAVQQTLALADAWRQDGRPRQIATVNMDFLTNALGWTPWAPPRHPELLDILRRADRVTADGMPVVWLARMLGTPLSGRVTGADLVPALASAMARTGHRLFLLGGRGDIGQQAADKLQQQNPGLQIAGVYSPFVHTEGAAALNAETDDAEIIERINRAAPDVLLIGFGNPKQELWFHRNRHRLRAGVSIGVGGTFEFIVGRVARAPEWMQRSGLEWIYRITQDPGRLWKRYAVGLLKLAVMGMPMALHYRWRQWRCPAGQAAMAATLQPSPPASPATGEIVWVLPARVDAAWVQSQAPLPGMSSGQPRSLVVDFTAVRFLGAAALAYLVRLWKSAQTAQWSIRAVGIERAAVAGLLKMTRTWDLFTETSYPSLSAPVTTSLTAGGLITLADPVAGVATAGLNGRLDVDRVIKMDVEAFAAVLGDGDCVLDLSGLRFVDSTGLQWLFHLRRRFNDRGRELVLCGAQPPVRQLLAITRLTDQFCQAANREQALGLIAARRSATGGAEDSL